ncbi:AAA family ATPase [Streptosporangium sandarakinum]|uniref:AAA family ATPase n=1 Tax=Streptosporangium sandarakinum TaxID=1260955 RepID=UPI0036AF5B1B
MRIGSPRTRLIVLRGNSASGKSGVARALQATRDRDLAVIGQDTVRRDILRERDVPGGANIGLIDVIARYSLDQGYHVLLEGMLYADRYERMLQALRADHRGPAHFYYLDVSFDETLRRHATKPQSGMYGEAEMRQWYRPRDLLPDGSETIIGEDSSLEETVRRILRETGLSSQPRDGAGEPQ